MSEDRDNAEPLAINSEGDYQRVLKTLTKKDRPSRILRFLMGVMESYRAARQYGWSRPWNKYNVVNFQSFKLQFDRDADLIDRCRAVLATECADMPAAASRFIDELLAQRERLMGFIFVYEYEDRGTQYEGANLSFGRKATDAPRYRDRFDLILESPVAEGVSQGLQRLRVYVDPYNGEKAPLWSAQQRPAGTAATRLFDHLADISWHWADDPQRIWDHWTSAYIDYFGPRRLSLQKSYFHVPGAPWVRLASTRGAEAETAETERAYSV